MTKMIDHIFLPDQSLVEIHDHGRGKPCGIATLNENNRLEQMFSGYADEYPSPIEDMSLLDYVFYYIESYVPEV